MKEVKNPFRLLPTVLSGFFAIRSRRDAEKDISYPPITLALAALLFIACFVGAIVSIVKIVTAH